MIHGGRVSDLEACTCWHPTGCQCPADHEFEESDDDGWGSDGSDGWDDDDDGWDI